MGSFGARLKREREQRKVTLDDISVSTKIGTRLLRALEEEHFDQLPGGIFNKGFVRAYARHLGLDEEQAIADYLEASGANPPGVPSEAIEKKPVIEPRPEPSTDATSIPWGILAAILLAVAFGFAAWGFYTREKDGASARPSEPVAVSASSSGAETPAGAAASDHNSAAGQNANTGTAPSPGASSAPPVPQAATETPSPAAFTVVIQAREDCWVTITADGTKIMQNLMVAPAEKSIGAQKEVVVRGGNVGALDFFFNGKKLPSQGDYGEVKTLTFDVDGLQVKPPPVAPDQAPPQP